MKDLSQPYEPRPIKRVTRSSRGSQSERFDIPVGAIYELLEGSGLIHQHLCRSNDTVMRIPQRFGEELTIHVGGKCDVVVRHKDEIASAPVRYFRADVARLGVGLAPPQLPETDTGLAEKPPPYYPCFPNRVRQPVCEES